MAERGVAWEKLNLEGKSWVLGPGRPFLGGSREVQSDREYVAEKGQKAAEFSRRWRRRAGALKSV